MFGFKRNSNNTSSNSSNSNPSKMSSEIEKAAMRVATGNLNENDKYVMRCKEEFSNLYAPKWR